MYQNGKFDDSKCSVSLKLSDTRNTIEDITFAGFPANIYNFFKYLLRYPASQMSSSSLFDFCCTLIIGPLVMINFNFLYFFKESSIFSLYCMLYYDNFNRRLVWLCLTSLLGTHRRFGFPNIWWAGFMVYVIEYSVS